MLNFTQTFIGYSLHFIFVMLCQMLLEKKLQTGPCHFVFKSAVFTVAALLKLVVVN